MSVRNSSRYPNPYSTPVPQLDEMRQSGTLINTDVSTVPKGVNTPQLQTVELSSESNNGNTYQTDALVNKNTNEMYDPQDLPPEVMDELINSGQLIGVGYSTQSKSQCRYVNGEPHCERFHETVVSGMGPTGIVYKSRMN